MKRRPLTVEEPAAAYVAEKPLAKVPATPAPKAAAPAQTVIRYARLEDVQKANERVMKIHGDVLRRLAQ
jgi:hypothetical protein